MPARRPNGHPAVYCSPLCHNRGNSALIRRRNSSLDEMAVMRLVSGDPVASTRAERIAAVGALTAHGRSTSWIAAHLHTTTRSVTRYRAELNPARKAVAA